MISPLVGRVDPNYHLDCDQDYEFLEGTSSMEIDGERRTYGPGETASVPKGTPHRDPFNRSDQPISSLPRSRYRAGIPRSIQRAMPPPAAAIGRVLGYRA